MEKVDLGVWWNPFTWFEPSYLQPHAPPPEAAATIEKIAAKIAPKTKVEVTNYQEYPVKKGEIYELHFRITNIPIISTLQQKNITALLSRQASFNLLGLELKDKNLISTIQITENPFPIALTITLIIGLAASLLLYLSITKAYQILTIPEVRRVISLPIIALSVLALVYVVNLVKGVKHEK